MIIAVFRQLTSVTGRPCRLPLLGRQLRRAVRAPPAENLQGGGHAACRGLGPDGGIAQRAFEIAGFFVTSDSNNNAIG
ncbi:MAG: hypothetical protein RLQ73_08870 [Hoeflea sp. D1-CHI-28]